jgi:hypothetical protein
MPPHLRTIPARENRSKVKDRKNCDQSCSNEISKKDIRIKGIGYIRIVAKYGSGQRA